VQQCAGSELIPCDVQVLSKVILNMSTYLPPAPAVKDVPSRIAVATSKGVDIIPTFEALDADLGAVFF
jgi:hypothetical protein